MPLREAPVPVTVTTWAAVAGVADRIESRRTTGIHFLSGDSSRSLLPDRGSRYVDRSRIGNPYTVSIQYTECALGVDGHGRAKYYFHTSRGARSERGGLRSYPLNLIRIMPAQGSQRDARPANASARFFILRSCA